MKYSRIWDYGQANNNGFMIGAHLETQDKSLMHIKISSQKYEDTEDFLRDFISCHKQIEWIFYFLFAAITYTAIKFHLLVFGWSPFWLLFSAGAAISALQAGRALAGCYYISIWKSLCQWHSVEHKCANLAKKYFLGKADLNPENFRKTSRIHIDCGTTNGAFPILTYLFWLAALVVNSFLPMCLAFLLWFEILLSANLIRRRLIWLYKFFRFVSFPLLFLTTAALQIIFTTAFPTKEQLKIGFNVLECGIKMAEETIARNPDIDIALIEIQIADD